MFYFKPKVQNLKKLIFVEDSNGLDLKQISCHGKITHILAANICRQFFFAMNTVASTRCLVENFAIRSE